MTSRAMTALTILTLSTLAAAPAMAQSVTMKYSGTGKGSNVRVTFGTTTDDVFAGQLRHSITSPANTDPRLNGNFVTFCIELSQVVSGQNRSFDVVQLNTAPSIQGDKAMRATALESLFANVGNAPLMWNASNDYATAFQLAIWEIIHDFDSSKTNAGLDVTAGEFTARRTNNSALSTGVMNNLNTFLGFARAGTSMPMSHSLLGIANGTNQDQVTVIPTPAAAALAGLGMGLIAVRRRRADGPKAA